MYLEISQGKWEVNLVWTLNIKNEHERYLNTIKLKPTLHSQVVKMRDKMKVLSIFSFHYAYLRP